MLHFLTDADAGLLYKDTLNEWHNPNRLAPDEALGHMALVRKWALGSSTARSILDFIDNSHIRINVVCLSGGGETVFSSDDPKGSGCGVIFWDVKAKFAIKRGTVETPLHNYVAMLHEMGHARQWIENPMFFDGNMLHALAGEKAMGEAARAFYRRNAEKILERRKAGSDLTLKPRPVMHYMGNNAAKTKVYLMGPPPAAAAAAAAALPPADPAGGPPPPPPGPPGPPPMPAFGAKSAPKPGDLLAAEYMVGGQQRLGPRAAWSVRIEMDNLLRHEWPICRETGNPLRDGYTDLKIA